MWREKASGAVLAEISGVFDTDILLVEQVTKGIGLSTLVMWDSGSVTTQLLVRFQKDAPGKVRLATIQTAHRSSDPTVEPSVTASFAGGVHWMFDAREADGGIWIDLTSFALRDTTRMSLVSILASTYGLDFTVDVDRSSLTADKCKARARFSCIEAQVTFARQPTGAASSLSAISKRRGWDPSHSLPDSTAISGSVRRTFVLLPKLETYRPRMYIPKSGLNHIAWNDEGAPLLTDRSVRYIVRHDLEAAWRGPRPKLLYYLDSACPNPEAILQGVNWWDQAFQAAGWPAGTFEARTAPAGVDIFDIDPEGFSAISWIHRTHRTYSVGQRIEDPRTGQIIKGHARLGSLRGRQDALIGVGLVQPYPGGGFNGQDVGGRRRASMVGGSLTAKAAAIERDVHRRYSHLGAHEVGHTIGLCHNFMGTAVCHGEGCDSSVMDYPFPHVSTDGQRLELVDAYHLGIGSMDNVSISYAYARLPSPPPVDSEPLIGRAAAASELPALRALLQRGELAGYSFLTDGDQGAGIDWRASKWDSGSDPAAALTHALAVREVALSTLGKNSLKDGQPLTELRRFYTPIYLWHRYEVLAASRALGGVLYSHATKGDPDSALATICPPELQAASLAALLAAVSPAALATPQAISRLMAQPMPFGYDTADPAAPDSHELLAGRAGGLYDPMSAAEIAASMVFKELLSSTRIARLHLQGLGALGLPGSTSSHPAPSLADVLATITATLAKDACGKNGDMLLQQYGLVAWQVYADHLLRLVSGSASSFRLHSILQRAVAQAVEAIGDCGPCRSQCTSTRDTMYYEWDNLRGLLTKGRPFITDPLPVPIGPPI